MCVCLDSTGQLHHIPNLTCSDVEHPLQTDTLTFYPVFISRSSRRSAPSSHSSKETTRAGEILCDTTSPPMTALWRYVCRNEGSKSQRLLCYIAYGWRHSDFVTRDALQDSHLWHTKVSVWLKERSSHKKAKSWNYIIYIIHNKWIKHWT